MSKVKIRNQQKDFSFCDFIAIFRKKFIFTLNFTEIEKTKLIEARKRRNISQERMADILSMDVSNYNRREKGTAKISLSEWQKIAEVLEVPFEEVYENEESLVFIFNDNSTGNGIVNTNNYNIPLSLWESQKKYIDKLEEEIEALKAEIAKYK
ncbi:helix-turn-helix transcriptional regulator [Chryseobacterium sp. APV1]|uniref:Helix-turn-helix transcriptional regulator n=1 Tax=Chryseobacterium urinae TaxID=3058400 RepID=A0ABT8U5B8_9FLAO|nr:helix-turn-helix transcriptional regulator [Chryseobacterium sp. APV1]MDO3424823.1 helix-turn-helix transcriptional regulator [Chryseobacterium sp. APV1]